MIGVVPVGEYVGVIDDFVLGSTAVRPSDVDVSTRAVCSNCGRDVVKKSTGAVVHVGTWKATCGASRARGRIRG